MKPVVVEKLSAPGLTMLEALLLVGLGLALLALAALVLWRFFRACRTLERIAEDLAALRSGKS